jgi:hypothetical protein
MLGNLARRKRRLSEALDHHREALEARRLFDAPPHELAASLTAYGGTFLDQGDYPAALALTSTIRKSLKNSTSTRWSKTCTR